MKIKLLRNTVASGTHLEAGKTYDVDEGDAKLLLSAGRAVKIDPEPKPEASKPRKPAPTAE